MQSPPARPEVAVTFSNAFSSKEDMLNLTRRGFA
jgi:hypothetical protein